MDIHQSSFQIGWERSRHIFLRINIADVVLKVPDEGVHEFESNSLEYLVDLLLFFL